MANELKSMNGDALITALSRYYVARDPVDQIIADYDLDVVPSQFVRELPCKMVGEVCDACGEQHVTRWLSRTHAPECEGVFDYPYEELCVTPGCGHINQSPVCVCPYCTEAETQHLYDRDNEDLVAAREAACLPADIRQGMMLAWWAMTAANDDGLIGLVDMLSEANVPGHQGDLSTWDMQEIVRNLRGMGAIAVDPDRIDYYLSVENGERQIYYRHRDAYFHAPPYLNAISGCGNNEVERWQSQHRRSLCALLLQKGQAKKFERDFRELAMLHAGDILAQQLELKSAMGGIDFADAYLRLRGDIETFLEAGCLAELSYVANRSAEKLAARLHSERMYKQHATNFYIGALRRLASQFITKGWSCEMFDPHPALNSPGVLRLYAELMEALGREEVESFLAVGLSGRGEAWLWEQKRLLRLTLPKDLGFIVSAMEDEVGTSLGLSYEV